jgi:hypothetical protein
MNAGKSSKPSRQGRDLKTLAIALAMPVLMTTTQLHAGAACVIAKKQGDSLAIEWVASPSVSAATAILEAQQRLIDQGYRTKGQDVHTQAVTELRNAYMAIVKTQFTTLRGRSRTSYGCGYSPRSAAEAERAAVYDLRNYSWGWKPEMGYEVVEALRY